MFTKKFGRIILLLALSGLGIWLVTRTAGPAPEGLVRQQAVQQALAPRRTNEQPDTSPTLSENEGSIVRAQPVVPAIVDVRTIPSRAADVDILQQRYLAGELDLDVNEGPVSAAVYQNLLAQSRQQRVDKSVQNRPGSALEGTLNAGTNFKSIDYTQSQQGVPPDPDIMVGKDHVVVGVNTSFQVFDKSGNSLVGPLLYADFWGGNCGTGSGVTLFDPYSVYDEEAGRYVLGITAYDPNVNGGNNGYACIAVSQTDSAAGQWYLYSFDGNPGGGSDYFFDYPHIGVGQDALYLGANMFGTSFVRNHIFAFDKSAMYAGQAANSTKLNVGTSNFTLQPAKIKGFTTGGWPTNPNEPHYFVDAQYGNNQNTLTVWAFSDPFGSASLTQAGTVSVSSYSLPLDQPQQGGSNIQGNDNRLLDVEYWGGRLWATHTIGCNPGGGTVNCIRWYELDISSGSPTLVQQGTLGSSSIYRSFPDLGVNACGDMLVGYTMTSSSIYPSVYVAGREAGDVAGQLKSETLLKAGEDFYTAYDSAPRRWGDYTGMALDPDGQTFWYVGEYSRPQATARWSTWVGSFIWSDCNLGPTPTPGPTASPTSTPVPTVTPSPTPAPDGLFCSTGSVAIPTSGNATDSLSVTDGRSLTDLNLIIDASHTWVGDLTFTLVHEASGTSVTVIDRPGVPGSTYGCSGDDIDAALDDESATTVENQCGGGTPTISGTFSPNNALSAFDGETVGGTWRLDINDAVSPDGGSLNQWCLEATLGGSAPTPTNTPLPMATNTPMPTATNTPLPTATNTPLPTATNTPLPTATNTPLPTATNTPQPTATNTPPPTATSTPAPGGDIFFDDFESSLGWITNPSGTDDATTGQWEVGNPEATNYSGPKQLGTTVSGSNDLVTARLAGSSVGSNDVDGGVTSVRSPNISLPGSGNIALSFSYYMAHTNNSSTADFLRVSVVGSSTQVVLLEELGAGNDDDAAWATFNTSLNSFAGQTIYLLVEAADNGGGSIVEAALDDVRITADGTPSPTPSPTPVAGGCTTYTSSDVPIALPNGTASISSILNISGAGTINDLNVTVDMDHAWVGDLSFVLRHQETGTAVTIIDRPGVPASTYGCSGDDITATLDDAAAAAVESQCAGTTPTISGTFSPNNALSALNGESGSGTWALEVSDAYTAADAGTLNGWSVEICTP